jgi:eukaryotic-like serine/threonine-protein kinase
VEVLADRYRRARSLGSGAMGEVWLAEDTLLGRPVAIKQLRTDPEATLGQWGERMRREARLAAQLNHPNAVAIYDLVVVDEQPYLVMEYVPGDSLAQRTRLAGRLAPQQAARWVGQVASALEAAHARGIVHRDVKPANILITPYDAAKLTDFGIARSAQDVSQTQTGILVGTPAFLAPEVARGGDPSPASDTWSLGATLYAAVEGRPPFGSGVDNPLAVLARIGSEPVPPPSSAGWLTPLLAALLDRDPARRPTAAQVRAALASATSDAEPTQPRPAPPAGFTPRQVYPPPPPASARASRRSRWLVPGIVAAVLIVAGGIVAAVVRSSSSPAAHGSNTPATTGAASTSPDFPSTSTVATSPSARSSATTRPSPTRYPRPADVPSLPSSGQAVPVGATPPGAPANPRVRPYTTPDRTPTTAAQLVEWRPRGLSGDAAAAVSSITRFLLDINRQDMQAAWNQSTEIRHGASPDQRFLTGYRTSRHYQVAFGQPRRLSADLIAVPARFVSRQDPAAQGNPTGVTNCTYWPQYVFLVADVGGRWIDDVAADYIDRPSVAPLKRHDTVRDAAELQPLQQRVAC